MRVGNEVCFRLGMGYPFIGSWLRESLQRTKLEDFCKKDEALGQKSVQSLGCIFSRVQPFYEQAVSDLDP